MGRDGNVRVGSYKSGHDDTVVTAHGARRLPGLAGRPLPTVRERLIAMPYAGNEYNSVRRL